ncbi:MAG: flagellar biosynthesis protein FlhB [Phycisphaerales bacterium]|nr:MAG: flagellar biosynthesis protein FlhB [Phycisphaerales bacterium]
MPEDLGERTEEATPKRKEEAREEGNVSRSQDLAGALVLLVATAATAVLAVRMLGQAKIALGAVLAGDTVANPLDPDETRGYIMYVGAAAIRVGAPILIVLWMAAYLSHFWQVGWLVAPKSLLPKFSKLNPISGFQRVFGISALVKAILDTLKVTIVLIVAAWTILGSVDRIMLLPHLDILPALVEIGWMLLDLAFRTLLVLLLLGVIDFVYQKWKGRHDLKMTKQQVKDELKQTEGDPETKRRRMRMAQQISAQRVSATVPKADVVVTNPDHVAVALQYDADEMSAPKVIAKGADYVAMRIRRIAIQHGIPIIQRPPLARALYKEVPVGQEVPPAFYQAVAEILAYVYRLSGRMAG